MCGSFFYSINDGGKAGNASWARLDTKDILLRRLARVCRGPGWVSSGLKKNSLKNIYKHFLFKL